MRREKPNWFPLVRSAPDGGGVVGGVTAVWKDRRLHRDRPAEGGGNKMVVLYLCPGGGGGGVAGGSLV